MPKPVRVDLWTWSLRTEARQFDAYWRLLSPEERARAERFVFERDRHRFVAARARMREVLGEIVGEPARTVHFEYGAQGKPSLAGVASLHFNLSHSADRALLAICAELPVGVDLEALGSADLALAQRFFSDDECAQLMALPKHQRSRGFFECWTRKEAFIKALGTGLSTPLNAFTVSLGSDTPPRLLWIDPVIDGTVDAWALASLEPGENYLGAIAVRAFGRAIEVVMRQ